MSEINVAVPVGAIEGDLACRKCGYNLRGLDVAGRCPECGTAVGYSVRGDLLRFSDPDWLRTLRRGMTLILLAVLVLVLIVIVNAVVLGAFRGAVPPVALALLPLVGLAAQALWYAGVWFITESDPSGLGEDDYGALRRFIRIAMLVSVASALVTLVLQYATIPDALATGLAVVNGLASLLGLAGYCCQLIYLSRLARRLPEPKLVRRGKTLAWTIGGSYGSILLIGLIAVVTQIGRTGGGPRPGLMAVGCIGSIAGIVLLVSGVLYLLMLERFGKRLKEEESVARQTWAAAPAPTA